MQEYQKEKKVNTCENNYAYRCSRLKKVKEKTLRFNWGDSLTLLKEK